MFRFPRWKILSIIGMTLIAFLLIVPSLMPEASFKSLKASLPRWLRRWRSSQLRRPVADSMLPGSQTRSSAHLPAFDSTRNSLPGADGP